MEIYHVKNIELNTNNASQCASFMCKTITLLQTTYPFLTHSEDNLKNPRKKNLTWRNKNSTSKLMAGLELADYTHWYWTILEIFFQVESLSFSNHLQNGLEWQGAARKESQFSLPQSLKIWPRGREGWPSGHFINCCTKGEHVNLGQLGVIVI